MQLHDANAEIHRRNVGNYVMDNVEEWAVLGSEIQIRRGSQMTIWSGENGSVVLPPRTEYVMAFKSQEDKRGVCE